MLERIDDDDDDGAGGGGDDDGEEDGDESGESGESGEGKEEDVEDKATMAEGLMMAYFDSIPGKTNGERGGGETQQRTATTSSASPLSGLSLAG
ncbi:hypothetical protein TWF481_004277 [Arthrobotrys musiformis]|uniref:Uncharacterized protein n=1 Tax=Arthrobotrys musiformis TaxID=47236 RepID=A0AAV9WL56_9PEZI